MSLTNKMTGEFVSMHDAKLQWCEQTSKNGKTTVYSINYHSFHDCFLEC